MERRRSIFLKCANSLPLAPAIVDLGNKAYLARIVAAYYTLGNYESVTWIDTIMDAYTGQDVLDESAYARRYQRYFPEKYRQPPIKVACDMLNALSTRSGMAHVSIWQNYSKNLAQAEIDMDGESSEAIRAITAYLTLGSYGRLNDTRALQ